jgi:hypothetical protein
MANSASDFDTFVKRQQALKEQQKPVDWAAQRDRWLGDLNESYSKIERFLDKYIKAGDITIQYRDHFLNEENIGTYAARIMVLRIGQQEITLTPIGTLLIGAKGRVDVVGPAGSTRFMLLNRDATGMGVKINIITPGSPKKEEPPKEIQWEWKIVTNPPAMRFIELTQESLFQALLEVANG